MKTEAEIRQHALDLLLLAKVAWRLRPEVAPNLASASRALFWVVGEENGYDAIVADVAEKAQKAREVNSENGSRD